MSVQNPDKYAHCPVPKTHRRLAEAHLLWHQTLEKYHDPEAFRANLNATIEALRNVTFVLQNEKHAFPNFDDWYAPWQARLKASSCAKWLHDARTTVVHQGELESHSLAEVRLVTWRDDVLTSVQVPPQIPSSLILENLSLVDLLHNFRVQMNDVKDAAIAIERRWVTPALQDSELLEVLAQVYGILSDMLLDAHIRKQQLDCIDGNDDHRDFCSIHHRTGMLECMVVGGDQRTQRFKLATRDELTPIVMADSTSVDASEVIARYGHIEPQPAWETHDPLKAAERILFLAKRMLRRDKNHHRRMFIRDGSGKWHSSGLIAADRTEKYLLMRMVAQFIESKGCDAIIEVGEMWTAPADSMHNIDSHDLEAAKDRGELLYVGVITRGGISRAYLTPFKRGPFGGIKLGDTIQDDNLVLQSYRPVIEVWRKQGYVVSPDGKAYPRPWDPDPLDVCFCGGPNRFAECCQPLVTSEPNPALSYKEIDLALGMSDWLRAEKLARAAVAQYVIWIKRHTVPTMTVAEDLHKQLIDIDLHAVEAHLDTLNEVLDKTGQADLFVPLVRQIAAVIGIPQLHMRLTALASRWLLAAGRVEEAILELDSLGPLDKVDDSLSLLTAAQIVDSPAEEKEQLIRKSCASATCDEEKWVAQLFLVEHLLSTGKSEDALGVVDHLIAERGIAGTQMDADARVLRWRITKSQNDLMAAKSTVRTASAGLRRRFGGTLIDEGLYVDADDVLARDLAREDPASKLLVVDSRLRRGLIVSARDLFLSISPDDIKGTDHYLYAVAAGLVALATDDQISARLHAAAFLGYLALMQRWTLKWQIYFRPSSDKLGFAVSTISLSGLRKSNQSTSPPCPHAAAATPAHSLLRAEAPQSPPPPPGRLTA